MKFKKTDWIAIAIILATFIQLIIVYPSLPAQVPINWGFDGQVQYGAKSNLWLLAGINAALYPLFFIIPKIDPKGKSYNKVDGFYKNFRLVILVFLAAILEITIFSSTDAHRFDVGKIAGIGLALLLIFIGNYLPKCKQSYTLGIKTMWTLADERVWNDTHRLGGMAFVAAGVISLVATLLLPEKLYYIISMITVGAAVVGTTVYSYISYRKYNKDN